MMGDQDPPRGYGNPPKSKQFRNGHTPHNKRAPPPDSFKEAAARALRTPRTVLVGDVPKTMSSREILVWEDVQKAVNGNVSAIVRIVTIMMQNPEVIEGETEFCVFITGAAARL